MGTLPTKMPTRESLGQAPSGALRRNIPSIRLPREPLGAATGAAMAGFGKQISNAADAVYDHDQRTQAFETERNFQEWEWGQKKSLDDQARNIQPGQAKTFAEDWQQGYLENGKDFYKSVPDTLKPFYEAKMMRSERELHGAAMQIGRTEQKRFSVNSLGDTLNNVYAPQARVSTTEDLDKVTGNFERLVRANPDLTPVEADEINRKARRHIALSHVDALPPDQVKTVLGGKGTVSDTIDKAAADAGTSADFLKRYAQIESGGDPKAKTGSYKGLFQLSDEEFTKYGGGDIFNAQDNANAAARKLAAESATFKSKYGRDPQAYELYLIHQQGEGGFAAHSAKPDAPAWQNMASTGEGRAKGEKWAKTAIWGNIPDQAKKQFGSVDNVSSQDFMDLWKARVDRAGGPGGGALSALTDDDRKTAMAKADTAIARQNNQASVDRGELYERGLVDAESGNGRLMPRSSIENDEVLTEQRRNALLKQHDHVAKTFVKYADFAQRFANGGTFNPYDTDDRKGVDTTFQQLGGDMPALKHVVDVTGMVPTSVATKLRGDLVSNNAGRVEQALQSATSLSAQKPTIFAGIPGQKELDDAADTFRTRVDQFGMTSKEAAQKHVDEQSPEYQAKKNARIKSEDMDKIVKDKLNVNDLRSAFDQSWWPGKPQVGFEPRTRLTMYSDYTSLFREFYQENGDVSLAKSLAQDKLKKIWGVSQVNGSDTVMRYPPERAPAFQDIDKASEKIATQAIASIKEETGEDVTRTQLRLDPVPGGRTSNAYWRGDPPPYLVSWQDKNGTVHTLNPGRAFVPDAKTLRDEQTTERQKTFETKAPQAIEYSAAQRNPVVGATGMRKELNAARRKMDAQRPDALPTGGGGGY